MRCLSCCLVAMVKCPDKSILKDKGFPLAHSSRLQYVMEKSQRQEAWWSWSHCVWSHKAERHTCMRTRVYLVFSIWYSPASPHQGLVPLRSNIVLPILISKLKMTPPHRHVQNTNLLNKLVNEWMAVVIRISNFDVYLFQYDGEIRVLYSTKVASSITSKKWGARELQIKPGESLEVIQSTDDTKVLCRNEEGKCKSPLKPHCAPDGWWVGCSGRSSLLTFFVLRFMGCRTY